MTLTSVKRTLPTVVARDVTLTWFHNQITSCNLMLRNRFLRYELKGSGGLKMFHEVVF